MENQIVVIDELIVNTDQAKKAQRLYRAINHKLRQQILRLIHQNEKMTVTEIYVKLRLEQSMASSHLCILRKAKLVNTERDGKFIWYSLNYKRIGDVHLHAAALLEFSVPGEQKIATTKKEKGQTGKSFLSTVLELLNSEKKE